MNVAVFFALVLTAHAQSLQVSSGSASRGSTGSVTIVLEAPAGAEPAALQWELQYPAGQLRIAVTDLTGGGAAEAAGKELQCGGRWVKQPQIHAYRCVLAGGLKRLRAGTVAVVAFEVLKDAPGGSAALVLADALGATPEGEAVQVSAVAGSVMIE